MFVHWGFFHHWPPTDLNNMPPWIPCCGFRFRGQLRFEVGCAELYRGFVTWIVTGQWVKMGCCLPRPSNPGITGNQPVQKRSAIVTLSHLEMVEAREAGCLNFGYVGWSVGCCPEGLGGGCNNMLKQFNSISLHNGGMVNDLYVNMLCRVLFLTSVCTSCTILNITARHKDNFSLISACVCVTFKPGFGLLKKYRSIGVKITCMLTQSVNQKQATTSGSGVFETKTQTKSLSVRWKCCHTTKSKWRMWMCVNNLSCEALDTQGYPLFPLARFKCVLHVKLCSQELSRSDTSQYAIIPYSRHKGNICGPKSQHTMKKEANSECLFSLPFIVGAILTV